ncbi:MFS polyamine transporter [Artomyces pyxidatus]|uniref:MFS polyamine transporter n=1 Tax=Artomyces pyxidatus TaxID=48021 RepID=A0ACB8SHT0_9AGAM|nr:MFS polyamine transporter [Artomyces pyxidatus]
MSDNASLKQGESTVPNSDRVPPSDHQSTKAEGEDVLIVDWDGHNDPENPLNWTFKQKWSAIAIVSSFTFISPVCSSMVAPASGVIAKQFGITSSVVTAMITSIFVLAYAIGPLFLGPLSEIYGRSRVLQIANLWFLVWNLACGFTQNTGQLISFRFLAGLGGSAPLSIGGGFISDLFRAEERGVAVALYTLGPLLGPIIGPIAGGWIAERSTWRWVFRSTTIADGVVQFFGLFFLQETYAPTLLKRRAKRIRKEMDEEKANRMEVRTVYETADRHWKAIFAKTMVRPFRLMALEPIIQVFGLYMAFVYGTFYIFLTTLPTIFQRLYHERIGIAGLNYLPLGIGLMLAAQLNARVLDRVYAYLKAKNGGAGRPEYRLPLLVPGSLIFPSGLLIAGWAAQKHVHWIVVDLGIGLIGASIVFIGLGVQSYVIDTFTLRAASAMAAVSCLRSLAGFGFPLFAPPMYEALGFGKGNTILAGVAVLLGVPAPFLLWRYGERIRGASKHARKLKPPQAPSPASTPP